MSLPRLAIVGAGRAGSALAYAWTRSGGETPLLWTRSRATADAAQAEGIRALCGAELPSFESYDLVVLAVSDGAVAATADAIATRRQVERSATAIHLSGALDLTPLRALQTLGLQVGSLHPAISIAHRRASLEGACAAVVGSSPHAERLLAGVAEQLQMRVIHPRGDRARYHAAACIAGNYPQVLLEAAIRLMEGVGLTREEAQQAAGALLISAANNAVERGPAAGLTGPVARGDVEVVRRHLDSLGGDHPLDALYRAAGSIAVELATERGAPNVDVLKGLLRPNR